MDGFRFDYIGKGNRTKVTQGVSIGFASAKHEFTIESSTANFIVGTDRTSVNMIFNIFDSAVHDNAYFTYTKGDALGLGYTITISGNLYYEN